MPDFDTIRTEHYQPAIEFGMAEQLTELAAVASNTELPTVANVIEAWEASGQLLTRALKAFQAKQLADTDAELDAIESAIAPLLAAHADAISLDWALYDRVVALAARRDAGDIVLDVQEAFWLERTLLAHGGSINVMDAYRDYRGQDPDLTHLLERRGLNPG